MSFGPDELWRLREAVTDRDEPGDTCDIDPERL